MKILHIWNTAGVASLMAKHLRRKGHHVDVLMRTGYDPFLMNEYYNYSLLNLSGNEFLNHAIKQAEHYDVIHVHAIYKIGKRLRELYPNKKLILQYHGTELTNCTDNAFRISQSLYFNHVLCSTNDLYNILKYESKRGILLENAVDTDIFKPKDQNKFKSALLFKIRYTDIDLIQSFVKSNTDWDVYLIDREKDFKTYSEMPILLNQFDKYIDVKIYSWTTGKPGEAYSKTGREALACGLKVLNYKGDIVSGLPEEFTPEYMIDRLLNIYNS